MITLDQIYLLEKKVESAVVRIQQLQKENDALRTECTELKNALSSKSEQLNTFESDQTQIENGIRHALDRLSLIENSVLKAVGQAAPVSQKQETITQKPTINSVPSFEALKPVAAQTVAVKTETSVTNNSIQPNIQNENIVETTSEPSESERQLEETLNWTNTEPVEENNTDLNDSVEQPSEFSFNDSSENLEEPTEGPDENSDELGFDIF